MDYFEILNLSREPFSNSPDPDFFFQSRQHKDCLQKLEISIRLRRGLNLIIGDVGTGKTTLCRELIRKFSEDDGIETHLLLDPHFASSRDFLLYIDKMFHGEEESSSSDRKTDDTNVKERVKQHLFTKGVEGNQTLVLIIDEGQKIPIPCLEILRELLNYETNEHKLLQIIIFAQKEFQKIAADHANFTDRINLFHMLGPLSFRDTWQMIVFRLKQSSSDQSVRPVFTLLAFIAIYFSTGGYPRKIINLCHQSILTMIVQNRTTAGWFLIRSCSKRSFSGKPTRIKFAVTVGLVALFMIMGSSSGYLNDFFSWETGLAQKIAEPVQIQKTNQSGGEIKANVSGIVKNNISTKNKKKEQGKTIISVHSKINDSGFPDPDMEKNGAGLDKIGEIPQVLGQLTIRKGDSLWNILQRVYGRFGPSILKEIAAVNPHLINPNSIETGTVFIFPAIRASVKKTTLPCWWIRLGERKSLEEAMAFIRSFPNREIPIRIIPYYTRKGLIFEIIAKEYFFNMASAQSLFDQIEKEQVPGAGVKTEWGEEKKVFFSNPYLVYRSK